MFAASTAARQNASDVEERILENLRTDLKRSPPDGLLASKIQRALEELRDMIPRWSLLLVRS
jgi:hypothetical protein